MSTSRKVVFANEQLYHIFNRSIERKTIFGRKKELARASETLRYYRFENLPLRFSKFLVQTEERQIEIEHLIDTPDNKSIEVLAYCFMPNHFHFLLRQLKDNGISQFVANFTNSYTKYFNTKYERNGPLMQGLFKAVLVETDEQLIHLSRYIHLNPVASFIIKERELETYPWSSLREYLGLETHNICDIAPILSQFPHKESYKQFVYDQISYAKELERIKHLAIEE